ncbi:hypothetical protein RUM43_006160 [Polyplax serrata]|uniref:Uncharacterized protein n=1 Tax=Polyplax serrata TaxID=468196 RepID=A0AAN8PAT8_POLSC
MKRFVAVALFQNKNTSDMVGGCVGKSEGSSSHSECERTEPFGRDTISGKKERGGRDPKMTTTTTMMTQSGEKPLRNGGRGRQLPWETNHLIVREGREKPSDDFLAPSHGDPKAAHFPPDQPSGR